MKKKSEWVEYTIKPSKVRATGESCFVLTWRSSKQPGIPNWHGIIKEEEIKALLTAKQFREWKTGRCEVFTKHLTVQERKDILKANNEKKALTHGG
jgi:hypothetical protein